MIGWLSGNQKDKSWGVVTREVLPFTYHETSLGCRDSRGRKLIMRDEEFQFSFRTLPMATAGARTRVVIRR